MNHETRTSPALVSLDQTIRIAVIVFPQMDQMDLTGPFAVFSRLPNAKVQLLWKNTEAVRDQGGLGLVPDASFDEASQIDLLVVPGGAGQEELMEDEEILRFIRERAAKALCVFSICTGSLICGAAGLLVSRKATTHWRSFELLKYFGAVPIDQRVVIDGKLVTAAGLTSGIDGALRVAAMLRGDEAAKAIQLELQYAPEPPFDCGSPKNAPAKMVAETKRQFAELFDRRLATAKRAAKRLGVAVAQ
jgi:cyclohexyl-isocyanide hydratase